MPVEARIAGITGIEGPRETLAAVFVGLVEVDQFRHLGAPILGADGVLYGFASSGGKPTGGVLYQIARDGSWKNHAPGALFFHARYVSPGWRKTRIAQIDNHIFYR